MATYRLVRRNDDKPHRCPVCHRICFRTRRRPPVARCTTCRLWWFTGFLGDRLGADTFAEYCAYMDEIERHASKEDPS